MGAAGRLGVSQREKREAFQQEAAARLAPLQQRKRKAEDAIVAAFAACERACQHERDLLRQLEDLAASERAMFELDHAKDQTMTVLKLALANLVMWTRDRYFPATYAQATWHRLAPFFRLPGRIVWGRDTVRSSCVPSMIVASRAIWRNCVSGWKPPSLGCPMDGAWCCGWPLPAAPLSAQPCQAASFPAHPPMLLPRADTSPR